MFGEFYNLGCSYALKKLGTVKYADALTRAISKGRITAKEVNRKARSAIEPGLENTLSIGMPQKLPASGYFTPRKPTSGLSSDLLHVPSYTQEQAAIKVRDTRGALRGEGQYVDATRLFETQRTPKERLDYFKQGDPPSPLFGSQRSTPTDWRKQRAADGPDVIAPTIFDKNYNPVK